MAKRGEEPRGRSTVVVTSRVRPEEKRLARLAAAAEGEVSLAAFVRRAVRSRAVRVAAERGLAVDEVQRKSREAHDAGS